MSRLVLAPVGLVGILVMAGIAGLFWEHLDVSAPPLQALAGEIVYAATAGPFDQVEPTPPATPAPTQTPDLQVAYGRVAATPIEAGESAAPPTDTAAPLPPTDTATAAPTAIPPSATPWPKARAAAMPQPAAEPPTRIVAPAIHLDVQVVKMGWKTVTRDGQKVSEWVVPKNAAGWHINSALPGAAGNTVLSGHNNVEGEVFRYLPDLEIGDTITLYAGGRAYTYTVCEKHLVKEAGATDAERLQNAQWIARTDDVRLTLVTCWPYRWPGNTHRMIIVARP